MKIVFRLRHLTLFRAKLIKKGIKGHHILTNFFSPLPPPPDHGASGPTSTSGSLRGEDQGEADPEALHRLQTQYGERVLTRTDEELLH